MDVTLTGPELDKALLATTSSLGPAPQLRLAPSESFHEFVARQAQAALAESSAEGFARRIELLAVRCVEVGYQIGRHRGIQ